MCNLYRITTNQAAIIALFRAINQYVGNLPPMWGVFPDYPAHCVSSHTHHMEATSPPQCLLNAAQSGPIGGKRTFGGAVLSIGR